MGDRCYSGVKTLRKHKKFFEDLGYNEIFDDQGNVVELEDSEANYGNHEELLAAKGIVFLANNSPGDNYARYGYASDGRGVECAEMTHGGDVFAVVNDDGTVNKPSLGDARRYIKMRDKVAQILERAKDVLVAELDERFGGNA